MINGLIADNENFKPLLDQMDPHEWYEKKGAPSTYMLQRQTAQQQISDVVTIGKQLAQKTEDLGLALDEYFRLEALDITARSLNEGVERYGDRATASKLAELIAHNFDNRQRFREYIRNLAASIQENFNIADQEAQRCRGIISKEPSPTARRSQK